MISTIFKWEKLMAEVLNLYYIAINFFLCTYAAIYVETIADYFHMYISGQSFAIQMLSYDSW